jgi:hypothetical protein
MPPVLIVLSSCAQAAVECHHLLRCRGTTTTFRRQCVLEQLKPPLRWMPPRSTVSHAAAPAETPPQAVPPPPAEARSLSPRRLPPSAGVGAVAELIVFIGIHMNAQNHLEKKITCIPDYQAHHQFITRWPI